METIYLYRYLYNSREFLVVGIKLLTPCSAQQLNVLYYVGILYVDG